MRFFGKFVINQAGQVFWFEGLKIVDQEMQEFYRMNHLACYLMDQFAAHGVATGVA